MPALKNKHLLWVASLCSLASIPLALNSVFAERRASAEAARSRESLDRSSEEVRDLRGKLDALLEAGRVEKLRVDRELAALRVQIAKGETAQANLGTLGVALKQVADQLALVAKKPWLADLELINEKVRSIDKRLEDQSRARSSAEPSPNTKPE